MTRRETKDEGNFKMTDKELQHKAAAKVSKEELQQILLEIQLEADALSDDEELTPTWTSEQKTQINERTTGTINKFQIISDITRSEKFATDEQAKIDLSCMLYGMQAEFAKLNRSAIRRNLRKIKAELDPKDKLETQNIIQTCIERMVDAIETMREWRAPRVEARANAIKQIDDLIPELLNLTEQAISCDIAINDFDAMFNEFTRLKIAHNSNANETLSEVERDITKLNKILSECVNFTNAVTMKLENSVK